MSSPLDLSKSAKLIKSVVKLSPKRIIRGNATLLDVLCSRQDMGIGRNYVRAKYIDTPETFWTVTKASIKRLVHIHTLSNYLFRGPRGEGGRLYV